MYSTQTASSKKRSGPAGLWVASCPVSAAGRQHEVREARCRGRRLTQSGIPRIDSCRHRIALLVSTLLYLVSRTAVLGAILLTGYLGGAVATHVRLVGPVFNIVFPIIFAALLWEALAARSPAARSSALPPLS